MFVNVLSSVYNPYANVLFRKLCDRNFCQILRMTFAKLLVFLQRYFRYFLAEMSTAIKSVCIRMQNMADKKNENVTQNILSKYVVCQIF